MKIACVCNQNNNMFSLVRYLRALGLEADLFLLNNEPAHFDPSCDTFKTDYLGYTRKVPWGAGAEFTKADFQAIANIFSAYDRIVACGNAVAFIAQAGRTIDVLIPYGDDFYRTPFIRPWECHPRLLANYLAFSAAQRRGIQSARHIVLDAAEPNFEAKMRRLRPRGAWHKLTPPALFLPEYEPEAMKKQYPVSALYRQMKDLRDSSDLVLFHHSRHHWVKTRDQPEWVLKANNVIFEGMREFLSARPSCKVRLVTFEYGPDVAASKRLSRDLGLEENTVWLPVSPRREIMVGLSLADIGIGEVHKSWFSYGVMMEVLASGRPFIGRRDPGTYPDQDNYAMISVTSPNELASAVSDYLTDTTKWNELGVEANSWLHRRFSAAVDRILSMLDVT